MNLLIQSVVDKRRQATGLSSNFATEGKAGEGGSGSELPSSAVVKNSLMMIQQRLVNEKVLSA